MSTTTNKYDISQEANDANVALASKITSSGSGYDSSILTFFGGKIYQGYGAHKENFLVDVDKWKQKRILGASGDLSKAIQIEPYSQKFKTMMDSAMRVQKVVDANPTVPVSSIVGSVGTPLVETDFTNVRRVNYLTNVKGVQYATELYNAPNIVNVTPTPNFYLRGFTRSSLLQGETNIGDDVIPEIAKNSFSTFDVDLYADSFHYAIGLRDRVGSVFALEQQYTQDLPGIFARMKDAKVITLVKALTPSAVTGGAWDGYTSDHFTYDAAIQIMSDEATLATYGGAEVVLWPLKTGAVYAKNVQGLTAVSPTSAIPAWQRTLAMNPRITGYENNGLTAGYYVIANRQWATLYQGPEILIAYQNRMTPGQIEGRIQFDFNKANTEVSSAAVYHSGANS